MGSEERFWSPVNCPVLSPAGKLAFIIHHVEDVTDSFDEWDAFVYGLSHDLRALLRAIRSFAKVILEESGEQIGFPGSDHVQRIISSTGRLDHLIEDVLVARGITALALACPARGMN